MTRGLLCLLVFGLVSLGAVAAAYASLAGSRRAADVDPQARSPGRPSTVTTTATRTPT